MKNENNNIQIFLTFERGVRCLEIILTAHMRNRHLAMWQTSYHSDQPLSNAHALRFESGKTEAEMHRKHFLAKLKTQILPSEWHRYWEWVHLPNSVYRVANKTVSTFRSLITLMNKTWMMNEEIQFLAWITPVHYLYLALTGDPPANIIAAIQRITKYTLN